MNKEELLNEILEQFNVNITQFESKSRKKNVVRARQVYCYLLYLNGVTINNIAKELGFDHSTVSYAVKTMKNEIQTNNEINDLVTKLYKKSI